MLNRIRSFQFSRVSLVIVLGAVLKFALHLYMAPGYGLFFDEFYTIALSRHLAFGYVDLPPLVPALMALSRLLLGESLLAMHIVPALAGAFTLVFACLIAKEFGGKTTAVALTALAFIGIPAWLMLDSIFCYDSIDQLILAAFIFCLVRFLRTGDKKLWLALGGIAGLACMTKMTILFLGPGFLVALLVSKYRRDLVTPWPWLGALLCLVIVSPYLLWQSANHWPTLQYWTSYGSQRVYQASLQQYTINVLLYLGPLLLPLWLFGLLRLFRHLAGVSYAFLGLWLLVTFVLLFRLHATARLLIELFLPVLAAGAVLLEEVVTRLHWRNWATAVLMLYLLGTGAINVPIALPVIPLDLLATVVHPFQPLYGSLREFNGESSALPVFLSGRIGWDELAGEVAAVYNALPPQDRAGTGIYTDSYGTAGVIDELGPRYGLPHAVSGSLTYYLWGPGYSWEKMIIVSGAANNMAVFFDTCEQKAVVQQEYALSNPHIFFCKGAKVPAAAIWSSVKAFR